MAASFPAGRDYPDMASLRTAADSEQISLAQSQPWQSALREAAGEELVRRYSYLVHQAARRYGNSAQPAEDLTQAS